MTCGLATRPGKAWTTALLSRFHPLEEALAAMGVAVWPMTELEADDGLASAAHIACRNRGVEKICIWSPDKDLAQCVRGDRIVQVDPQEAEDPRRGRSARQVPRSTRADPRLPRPCR